MRLVAISPVPVTASREIYGLAGQSNMSGRGLLSEVPTFANASRVKVFSNAWTWVDGAEPVDSAAGQIDTISSDPTAAVGPSMSFASSLAEIRLGVEIGLVPCAKGGSSLSQWSRNLSRGTLYGSFIARMKKAAETGVLKGILWYQGESEASVEANANAVKTSTEALFANFRSDLGISDLPIIATILGPNPAPARTDVPYWSTVQAQQALISGTNIAVVTAADLMAKTGDELHLTTASQVTLGQRYATAMQALL